MKTNMGSLDRAIRIIAAAAFILLAYTGVITGTLASVAYIFAAVFILTSLVGFCPLYALFGFNTCPIKK